MKIATEATLTPSTVPVGLPEKTMNPAASCTIPKSSSSHPHVSWLEEQELVREVVPGGSR